LTHQSIPAGTHIGHVHLKVADLDRAIAFYRDTLGFDLLYNMGTAAFLSAGGYHHHIALNTWESAGGQPPQGGSTGLYHFAINYPTRRDLAVAFKRLLESGWQIDGYNDHGTHLALYLHDPDFNGIELAWDRDPSEWPQFQGLSNDEAGRNMRDAHRRFDPRAFLAEADLPADAELEMTPA
jgi:catechol 2,3-dioxygenase